MRGATSRTTVVDGRIEPCSLLLLQESADRCDRLPRLLFHDPVPGVGDDRPLDVARDRFDLRLHRGTVGMIAADRQDRHAEFPYLCKQRLVLLGIFREGGKLPAEGVVNRAWSRVQRRIMATRLFVDAGRIGGEFVIETIKQDSLASGNEPLDVGATEVEMPYSRVQQLLLP